MRLSWADEFPCCILPWIMLQFHIVRSRFIVCLLYGWIPEWPKGTDCKSAANCFGGSNPPPSICVPTERVISQVQKFIDSVRWYGGIGRRKGLKIPRGQPRAGSSPATSMEWESTISARG